jgi:hypothetical protein
MLEYSQRRLGMVTINWNAQADLHRIEQMQSEPRLSPKYLKGRDGTFASLIKEVMAERAPDRQLYSIMVGDTVYDAAAIEVLYERTDFPRA